MGLAGTGVGWVPGTQEVGEGEGQAVAGGLTTAYQYKQVL